jgi:hypothetical protein
MLTLDKIYHAAYVLKDVVRETSLIRSKLNPDCELYLKAENLQITGSFKVRGAGYMMSQLTEEEKIALAALGNDRETEIRTYIDNYVDPRTNEDRFVRIVNVDIMSGVIITRPGVYSVTYTVDMDGNYKGYTRLHVVVEE